MRRLLFALGFVGIVLLATFTQPERAEAEGVRSTIAVPSLTGYYRDAAMAQTGIAVDFGGRSFAVWIDNEDGSNALLVKFIESGTVTAAELTAPSDATVSDVQSIPASRSVSFPDLHAVGLIYDRAAGTGAVTVRWTK